jgi:hypothetical protein
MNTRVVLASALLLWLSGCFLFVPPLESLEGLACDPEDDCGPGLTCSNQRCAPVSRRNGNDDGACPAQTACSTPLDGNDAVAVAGTCNQGVCVVDRCGNVDDKPCPEGFGCDPAETGGSGTCRSDVAVPACFVEGAGCRTQALTAGICRASDCVDVAGINFPEYAPGEPSRLNLLGSTADFVADGSDTYSLVAEVPAGVTIQVTFTQVGGDPTGFDAATILDRGNWQASETAPGVSALHSASGVALAPQVTFAGAGALVMDVFLNEGFFVSKRIDWGPLCDNVGSCTDERLCTGRICKVRDCTNGGVACETTDFCDLRSGQCVRNTFGDACTEVGGECPSPLRCQASPSGAVCGEPCGQLADCIACSRRSAAECTCTDEYFCSPPT